METLRVGSRGTNVELLQTALNRAGHSAGAADGIFGEKTKQAVTGFQQANNISGDGIVGDGTWHYIMPYLTGYTTHRIEPGDTLFRLSQRYGTSIPALLTANPEVTPTNLIPGAVLTVPLPFDVVPTDINFTSRLLALCVEGLTARYPFIGSSVIGTSLLGKPIYRLTIGRGTTKVMYNASHHANEWITTPVLMRFLELLAASFASIDLSLLGGIAAEVFDNAEIHLIPMVNPDGVDLVTGAIAPGSAAYDAAKSMNYLHLPFPDGWKANIAGVDLNLNYPAGWEIARQIKFEQGYTMPGPRDYVGPYPLSEPESVAVAEYTKAGDFALTLSYHTQGEVIYWRYLDYLPPRSYEIGQLFSRVSGYLLEDTPYASGHAGFKDWFIQEYNRPGYTIECGLGVNPLPVSQFGRIFRDNIGILTLAALVL